MSRRPVDPDALSWTVLAGAGALAVGVLWATRQLGSWVATGQWLTGPATNPFTMVIDLFKGRMHFTTAHIVIAAVLGLMALVLLLAVVLWMDKRARFRKSLAFKARKLGSGADMSLRAAQAKASKGQLVQGEIDPGLLFGKTMARGKPLYTAWREGLVVVMGPGSGKTTGLGTPMILDAPGAVFGTSNKRDIADQIRLSREQKGRCWFFDLQSIAGYHHGTPTWWWNVLSYVRDETRALALAAMFATTAKSGKKVGGSDSDFFEEAGKHLLARLLLAAATSGRYVDQVFLWLSDESDQEPCRLLQQAGFKMTARGLLHTYKSPPEQRGGVFATARGFVEFLENKAALEWITPLGEDDDREQFDHVAFIRSTASDAPQTLIALSKEGDGSMGPVTSALTKALLDSAEEYAMECGGRVPVPIVAMLDEAANCARIGDLPQKYSFYGSMGIHTVTILQSPHQGVSVWGETGWKLLWDASTIRIVGSGVKDMTFQRDLATQSGHHDVTRWNQSYGKGKSGYSTSTQTAREDILSPSDLANLKPGQIYVVHNNGSAPVLAETMPYYDRPEMNAAVEKSKALYGPKAKVA